MRYMSKVSESGCDGGDWMTEMGTTMLATDAGHPALAFVNTVTDNGKSRQKNSFADGKALLDQLRLGGLDYVGDAPGAGQLYELLHLREAAYSVLSAVAAGRQPRREDALVIEAAIKAAIADATLTPGTSGSLFRPGPLGGLHDTLVLSIMDLLQSGDLPRLRECQGCTHLFLDRGRGPGRRWCTMSRCGNRAKARGFRDRRRAAV
jgi:predicted RNA-binding Zn ribbon-like protein